MRPIHRLFKARTARGITFVLITIAIVGSLMPPQQIEQLTFSLSDKLIYGLYYAALTFFGSSATKHIQAKNISKLACPFSFWGWHWKSCKMFFPFNVKWMFKTYSPTRLESQLQSQRHAFWGFVNSITLNCIKLLF